MFRHGGKLFYPYLKTSSLQRDFLFASGSGFHRWDKNESGCEADMLEGAEGGRHSPPRPQQEPINLKNEVRAVKRRVGSKGPHDCAERLNIHRFVRAPVKKFETDQSAWYRRNLLASESIVSISELFYPHAHTPPSRGPAFLTIFFSTTLTPETAIHVHCADAKTTPHPSPHIPALKMEFP
ncbi:unnamed protein product, partial [Brenthis ino]